VSTYSRTAAGARRIRWALWRWRFGVTWRARRGWTIARGRGITLHPDRLDGTDGEPPHYIRGDLAATQAEALAVLVEEWGFDPFTERALDPEVREVAMLPLPMRDDDAYAEEWGGVAYFEKPFYTLGAVRYWKVSDS
jgi:hypothetical protein